MLVVSLPGQQLGGSARQRKQGLFYPTQNLVKAAALEAHWVQVNQLIEFDGVAWLPLPVTQKLLPDNQPVIRLHLLRWQQARLWRAHITDQFTALKNDMQSIIICFGWTCVGLKHRGNWVPA